MRIILIKFDKFTEIENAIKITLKAILNILSVVPMLFFIIFENFKG
jgi:hypothetical protein